MTLSSTASFVDRTQSLSNLVNKSRIWRDIVAWEPRAVQRGALIEALLKAVLV